MQNKFRFYFSDNKGFVVSTQASRDNHVYGNECGYTRHDVDILEVEPHPAQIIQLTPKFAFGEFKSIDFIVTCLTLTVEEYDQYIVQGVPAVVCIEDIAKLGDSSEIWGKPILLGIQLITVERCEVVGIHDQLIQDAELELLTYISVVKAAHTGGGCGKIYLFDENTGRPTCTSTVFSFERGDSKNWTIIPPSRNICKFVNSLQRWEPVYAMIDATGAVHFENAHSHLIYENVEHSIAAPIKLYLTEQEYRTLPKRAYPGMTWDFEANTWSDMRDTDAHRRRIIMQVHRMCGHLRGKLNDRFHWLSHKDFIPKNDYYLELIQYSDQVTQLHYELSSDIVEYISTLPDDHTNERLDIFEQVFGHICDGRYVSVLEKELYSKNMQTLYTTPVFSRHLELFGDTPVIYNEVITLILLNLLMDMVEDPAWVDQYISPDDFVEYVQIPIQVDETQPCGPEY